MSNNGGRRLAVVSGASSGIGRACAVDLGRRGFKVVLVARGREALELAAAEVVAAGGEAVVEACDASDGAAVVALAAKVVATHGAPYAVVNAAGLGEWRFIEESPPDDARRMLGAPFFAAYHLTHAFMKPMLGAGRGVFVHVGSPASFAPWAGATAYISSRWALRGLHEALCMDLAGTGLRSCHVVLGKVTSAYFDNNPGSEERIPAIGRWIPVTTPEKAGRIVAQAVERPRDEIIRPFMLLAFRWTQFVAPWLVRWLIGSTGVRHSTEGKVSGAA